MRISEEILRMLSKIRRVDLRYRRAAYQRYKRKSLIILDGDAPQKGSIRPAPVLRDYQALLAYIESETSHATHTIATIVCDLEKYEAHNARSVSGVDTHLKSIAGNKYNKLKFGVSLLKHTANVVVEILDITKSMPEIIRALCAILALAHDIGKIPSVKISYGNSPTEPHEVTSAEYLKSLLYRMYDEGIDPHISKEHAESLPAILREQHKRKRDDNADKSANEKKFSTLMEYLKDADSNARRKEISVLDTIPEAQEGAQ
jgi:hypothetical protein